MTAQHPAAPETDVSALTEALAKHLHERFAPDWAPHWDDLDPTEREDSIHADMARSLLEPDAAIPALLADLTATRERLRVVEGERDAAVRDVVALTNNYVQPLAEAEADRDALRAGIEALADEWDACDEHGNPLRDGFGEAADELRALLPGDGR